MQSVYGYAGRKTVCLNCGAAVSVPPLGGTLPCPSCGGGVQVGPRREERLQLSTPGTAPQVRAQRLVAQDGKPFDVPEELRGYLEGGSIAEWRVPEALAVWRSTAAQVAQSQDFAAAERLFVLTILLSGRASPLEDEMKRALLEAALDVLSLPRHQQFLLGLLGAAAAKRRDVQSAEQWLARCDPEAEDLPADSAWRIGRALLETARENYAGVLALLEPGGQPWPIQDAFDAQAVLLRANAHEQQGDLAGAEGILRAYLDGHGAQGRQLLRAGMEARGQLRLCPRSFAAAEQASARAAARNAASTGRAMGIIFVAAGLISFAVAVLTYLVTPEADRSDALLGGGIMGIVGLGLVVAGFVSTARAKAQQRIVLHGKPGTAKVLGLSRTGTEVNNVPVYKIQLEVHLEGTPPYPATVKKLLDPSVAALFVPGVQVPVKVDPTKPDRVVLDA